MANKKTAQSNSVNANQAPPVEVRARVKHGPLKGHKVTVFLDADDAVRDQVGGFVNFVREHAIVGLAVGFVVGAQAQAIVKQLITSFIDPLIQLLFGGTKLSERLVEVHFAGNSAKFGWGAMVYVLLNLLVVLATIYAVIKLFNLDKLDKPKDT